MVTFFPLNLTVSVGRTLVPGSVTNWPLTVTLPWRMSSAASRREQTPPWAMYLFRGSCSPWWAPGACFAPGVALAGAPGVCLASGVALPGAGLNGVALPELPGIGFATGGLAAADALAAGAFFIGLPAARSVGGWMGCLPVVRSVGRWVGRSPRWAGRSPGRSPGCGA